MKNFIDLLFHPPLDGAFLNPTSLAEFSAARRSARMAIENIISRPFDLKNETHLNQLKEYINNFEELQNEMYLYQGLLLGVIAGPCWLGSMFLSFLPIPQFLNQLLLFSTCVGIEGGLLGKFRRTDYDDELQDMKRLYNWCLKNNQTTRPPSLDNTEKLRLTEIQSLIKLLYPVCSPEFMLAWEVKPNSPPSTIKQVIKTTLSMFSSSNPSLQEETTSSDREFKETLVKIEQKKSGRKTAWEGLQQSVNYFTGPDSKIRAALSKPINASSSIINYLMTASSLN